MQRRMNACSSIAGIIVFDLKESPPYSSPDARRAGEKVASEDEFIATFMDAPNYGPISLKNRQWVGEVKCTAHVLLRGGNPVTAVGAFLIHILS